MSLLVSCFGGFVGGLKWLAELKKRKDQVLTSNRLFGIKPTGGFF
jgi:hypothetical protein